MRSIPTTALLLLLIGCASAANRPETIAQPQISLRPHGTIFFGSGDTASATLVFDITNRASVPLTVRDIEVSSPGMTQYTLQTRRQTFRDEIPPGGTKDYTVFTTAVTRVSSPNEPLTVRAVVTFEAAGATFREIVMQ
jgi:hypothetical protein